MLGSFLLVRAFAVGDKFRKTEDTIASLLSVVYFQIMGVAFLLIILLLCLKYTVKYLLLMCMGRTDNFGENKSPFSRTYFLPNTRLDSKALAFAAGY